MAAPIWSVTTEHDMVKHDIMVEHDIMVIVVFILLLQQLNSHIDLDIHSANQWGN